MAAAATEWCRVWPKTAAQDVNLLLLRMIVLTLAINSSFLDVDGRPERGSLSTEALLSLNLRNQSNTCVWRIASSPYACCNNWCFGYCFSDFKTKLDANALFGTFTHRKNRYDINAHVTSATYYSQLSKRSHLQLVSWVAKTCKNMSRLVTNTSHSVNNHYNSNPDTIWTSLIYPLFNVTFYERFLWIINNIFNTTTFW